MAGALLSSSLGGGPTANVNGQIGATNQQGVNVTRQAPTITVKPKGKIDNVDQSTTNNVNVPPWVIFVMMILAAGGAVGWVDNVVRFFWRKRNGKNTDR